MTCLDDPVILQNYTDALSFAGCKPDFIMLNLYQLTISRLACASVRLSRRTATVSPWLLGALLVALLAACDSTQPSTETAEVRPRLPGNRNWRLFRRHLGRGSGPVPR